MRILVIGSGGREHALVWKLAQSPHVKEIYCAPGNAGIEELAHCVPIAAEDIQELADFAQNLKIDLTVVGPELPLVLGIGDVFIKRGLRIFGPTSLAAEIEGSKIFAKEFLQRHGIPTAEAEVAESLEEGKALVKKRGLPVVLKADGLAAGKGVMVCQTQDEVDQALHLYFVEKKFGKAGERILVEECLEGEEASFMVISDGEHIVPLATAKDYKRVGEGDQGPNTGGMGAHSPAVVMDRDTIGEVLKNIILPTIQHLKEENREYRGVLYAGLMITSEGPKVLEFNCRFGDPETQPVLVRLASDLFELLFLASEGKYNLTRASWIKAAAGCLVLASQGYPGKYEKGFPITGLDALEEMDGVVVFHAGTARNEDGYITHGGRVLNVCATGETLAKAMSRCYLAAQRIHFENKYYRKDIAQKILRRMHYA